MMFRANILPYLAALEYEPMEFTAVFRICEVESTDTPPEEGKRWDNSPKAPLQESPYYVHEFHYRFADLDPDRSELYGQKELADETRKHYPGIVSNDTAYRILSDFHSVLVCRQATALLFHCNAGMSRSPATALALQHIFRLEFDWSDRAEWLIPTIQDCSTRESGWTPDPTDCVGNITVYNTLLKAAESFCIGCGCQSPLQTVEYTKDWNRPEQLCQSCVDSWKSFIGEQRESWVRANLYVSPLPYCWDQNRALQ